MMEATEKKLNFNLKSSDLLVQPLAFKTIALIEDASRLLQEEVGGKSPDYGSRISFIWSFQVRDLCIMLRDALINLLKIEEYYKDGLRSKEELEDYQESLMKVVEPAVEEVINSYENCSNRNDELNIDWEHQFNPVPALLKQIQTLEDQIKMIQRSQFKLDKVNEKFEDFRTSYEEHIDQRIEKTKRVVKQLESLKSTIEKEPDQLKRTEMVKLDQMILSTVQEVESSNSFAPYEYIILEDTDKLNLAVGTEGGQLVYKSIDILSEVTGWTSFNLASPLKNTDSKIQGFISRVAVNLVQLSNRIKAKLESANEEEIAYSKNNLTNPISKLLAEYNKEIETEEINKLQELKQEIDESIRGSQLFNNEYNFLPSSAIGQLTGLAEKSELQRRYNPSRIKKLLTNYSQNLFSKYSKNETTTPAGFIKNVLSFDAESDANSLFLRHGFLGSSFSIERQQLISRIEKHYSLWTQGFGGALLITGKHLSGKSTLLEILPIHYPQIASYHIVPGQKIDVKGHKRTMSDDLMETLRFIIKYRGTEKCMITIDDFEYYVDTPAEAYDLMQEVNRLISRHSKSVYFAMTMHSYLCDKFSNFFDLNNVFTENIVTDITPVDLIENAVVTRAHAVVNNEEVNQETETLSSLARKAARKSNENIGKAMQLWCLLKSEDYDPNLSSSNFKKLVKRHAALLRMLLLFGTVNQPKLLKMFNEVDGVKVKNDIEGLIQIHLLTRPKEACIAIHPYLKTYVESYLP